MLSTTFKLLFFKQVYKTKKKILNQFLCFLYSFYNCKYCFLLPIYENPKKKYGIAVCMM